MARELGESDVDGLLARMSMSQLREWIAFSRIEPFQADRLEIMLAQLTQLVANRTRTSEKERKYSMHDFLPKWGASAEEMKQDEAGRLRMEMLGRQLLRNLRGD